jgi:hypothetical protein
VPDALEEESEVLPPFDDYLVPVLRQVCKEGPVEGLYGLARRRNYDCKVMTFRSVTCNHSSLTRRSRLAGPQALIMPVEESKCETSAGPFLELDDLGRRPGCLEILRPERPGRRCSVVSSNVSRRRARVPPYSHGQQ